MPEKLAILLDNPILMKHVRARLRPAQVVPWAVVVLVICLCVLYGGYVSNTLITGQALGFLLFVQVVLIVFIGAQQISASVAGARVSGVIDFHRVSPLSRTAMVAGFFLGGPVREYLLAALTLPFALILGFLGPGGLIGLAAMELPILLAAWLFHAAALLSALVTKKPRASGGGAIGVVIAGLVFGQWIFFAIIGAATQLTGGVENIAFFGLRLPWFLLVLLYAIPALFFLLLPSVRKIRSERVHGYTKPQALACMTTFLLLALGGCWSFKAVEPMTLVLLYGFMLLGLILANPITPTQAEYVRGLRRAIRDGRLRPSFWSDEGVNRMGVGLLALLVTLGATIAWEAIEGRVAGRSRYSQTIAIGALVIVYSGLALQYFLLQFPKRGASLFGLFLFFVWMLPVMLGLISAAAGALESAPTIFAVSPLAGLALSTGLIDEDYAGPSRLAALAPAVTFTVVFFFLLDSAQRRLDRSVRSTMPRVELDPWSTPDLDEEVLAAKTSL